MVDTWQLTGGMFSTPPKTYENPKKSEQTTAWPQWLWHFLHWNRSKQPLTTAPAAASSATAAPITAQPTPEELTLTAVTLGLTTTGALLFPPLQLAALPLLLYLGVIPAHTAYAALRKKEGAPLALAETIVLAICLLRQAYLAGALSYGCYVVAKAWLQQQPTDAPLPVVTWQPPLWAWVQPDAVEEPKPVDELHRGERVVVHTGEMVPVTGVVTDGVAWVKARGVGGVKVEAGSTVEAMTIVQVGCIGLAVA